MKVLITGASSGMGYDMAKYLSTYNFDLFLVAKDKKELDKKFKDLKNKIKTYGFDLSKEEECIKLYKEVRNENIDILINNAGFGDAGKFTETNLDKEMNMIDLNIKAYHILTKLFLRDFVKRDYGRILNVASMAGFMPGPYMATYYATKNYIVSLSLAIYEELKKDKSNVKISIFCPGPVATNFNNVANVKFNISSLTSEFASRYAIDNMFKNKLIIMTNTIKTIIVDDEINSIHNLEEDLKAYPEIEILDTITSSQKAKKSIIQYQPDLLFLDVEMPYINGIELLQEIRPYVRNNMRVIFYSAFDKYMLDALRASAFDYLLKPYQTNELKQIVERIKREKTNNPINFDQAMRQLLSNDCKFAVQTISRLLLLRRSEILYFQYSEDTRCWQMTLTNMEQYRLRLSTKAKDILNFCPSFIRVNTDCILNIDYLSSVENNTLRCILYAPFSHLEISASRRHYSKIKEALNFL